MAQPTFDMARFQRLADELKTMKSTPEYVNAQKSIQKIARQKMSKMRNELHKTALKLYRAMENDGTLVTALKKYGITSKM